MKYQNRVLGMLSLLAVITYLDRVCIAVAGPRMQDSLGIGPEAWGWVTSVFFISYAAFEIPTGMMGDRIGARRVLTRIVTWWSAFTTLTGLVVSYPILLIVRFCFGIGEAGAYPNAALAIRRWIPERNRARAWGILWMTSQVGGAVAPLLVVPIQIHYGWRASFYVFGIIGIVWSAVWYAWFRDRPCEMRGVSAAELQEIGESASSGHGALPWSEALRSPSLWHIAMIAICGVFTIGFYQSWLPTYLAKGRGFSEASLMLSTLPYIVGALANIAGGLASDRLARRYGLRFGRCAVGAAGQGIAAICLAAAMIVSSDLATLIFLSLAYAGVLFQQPNTSAVSVDIGGTHTGAVFGFMNMCGNLGASASSIVFGYLVGSTGNYNAPFVPMIVLLCVGSILWLKMDPRRQVFDHQRAIGSLPVTAKA
jgi:MFS family permease